MLPVNPKHVSFKVFAFSWMIIMQDNANTLDQTYYTSFGLSDRAMTGHRYASTPWLTIITFNIMCWPPLKIICNKQISYHKPISILQDNLSDSSKWLEQLFNVSFSCSVWQSAKVYSASCHSDYNKNINLYVDKIRPVGGVTKISTDSVDIMNSK